jgi:hypothetical protein
MRRLLPMLVLTASAPFFASAWAGSNDALYEIKKTEPKVAVGTTGTASLTITTKGGWHVNAEAPISVAVTPSAGVSVPKPKLTRADLAASTETTARFDIALSAIEAGKKTINAETRFVLCQEQACKPVKETVALLVEVTPAIAEKAAPKKPKGK